MGVSTSLWTVKGSLLLFQVTLQVNLVVSSDTAEGRTALFQTSVGVAAGLLVSFA
jgi:hypothetical protein